MKITQSNAEKLVIVDFPWLIGGFCIIGAGGFLTQLVNGLMRNAMSSKEIWINITGFSLLACCGLFSSKRIAFSFDLRLRQLTWSRRGLLTGTQGTLSFSRISSVNLETTMDSENKGQLYRVTLTTNESVLPLTMAYTDGEAGHQAIRNAIAQALGIQIQSAVRDTDVSVAGLDLKADVAIRAMIARGEIIQAIKEVRALHNCGLAEAKKIVTYLQSQAAR